MSVQDGESAKLRWFVSGTFRICIFGRNHKELVKRWLPMPTSTPTAISIPIAYLKPLMKKISSEKVYIAV